jgi:mannosyltransferase
MLDALKKYKWYWRIEPDIDLYCDLTYDPFVEMAKHGKLYGFTISLWEDSYTARSLFKEVNDYKERNHFPTTELWKAMISPSWLPWPLRGWMAGGDHTDFSGDNWNQCHYWSNFEIADLDFFRSKAYQALYERLDRAGGFYYERVSLESRIESCCFSDKSAVG